MAGLPTKQLVPDQQPYRVYQPFLLAGVHGVEVAALNQL
jgi:hypothetical protein